MTLREQRSGRPLEFHVYPRVSEEGTLGNAETIIWASINHLCSVSVADFVAERFHKISRKRDRRRVAANLKLYIRHAAEFYQAASVAKPNTAPLIYYYSFLNLAKALCELTKPGLHEREECYSHGLSWRPNPHKVADLRTERVSISGKRGMWQALWESLVGPAYPSTSRIEVPVRALFSYCPEISAEYIKVFSFRLGCLDLESPSVMWDQKSRQAWLKFSIPRWGFWSRKVFAPAVLAQISTSRSNYLEVKSKNKESRTFESATPKSVSSADDARIALQDDIHAMNVVTMLTNRAKMSYFIPIQRYTSFPLPQALVSYTILFWLGSLVRYDPHSVQWLMDSEYWVLIDGFMSQSRLWLLELFQWAFYQTETTLYAAR